MEKEFLTFDGMYYEKYSNIEGNKFYSEHINVVSAPFDFNIKPHIHTKLHQFFFTESGQGVCVLNGQIYNLINPSVQIIPSNFIHAFKWGKNIQGRVLSISSSLIEKLLENNAAVCDFFNKPQFINSVDKSIFTNLLNSIDKINYDLFNQFPGKQTMISFKTGQFLIDIYRSFIKEGTTSSFLNSYELTKFNLFKKNIRENLELNKSILEHAKDLGLTITKLNRICHGIIGKSASWVVNDYIITEAKILLLYTEYSISEISYKLNFASHNYFTRFFKKHIGISPKQFRHINNKDK